MQTAGLRGFTLIEMVMVIVLLAIVATISVRFVSLSTQGALDVSARQQRSLAGVVISEQLSRELREALPTSIRTNSNGSCLEWMPILAASNYLTLPNASSPDRFEAVPLPYNRSATGRVVVYGYGEDLYEPKDPGPISPPATMPSGTAAVTVQFAGGATHQFASRSPERRFYLAASPVTVCQAGAYLFRYRDYGLNKAVATALPASHPKREVLAANLVSGSVRFQVEPPSQKRAAVVSFRFEISDAQSGETTAFDQEVQVRNVP
ncbi:MSHA biogenesis protein MshO [Marinobacter fuscus]|uniref:MSHA biogenesis protein MshO n=2 Tax=Marinobacter fuscus TaxID=2109942 RepID=A0A2T1K601_9GAMM|nr:type II secretion system protein [Marinobacter fuscus]PSF05589.1 MSHA biogenesis protein MshO [Marinobacter fuscus]